MQWTKTRKKGPASSGPNKELTYKERVSIETLLREGKSYREIASNINKGKSTVSDEVGKNGGKSGYNAERADRRHCLRRWRAKRNCNKVAMNRELSRYVEERLPLGWSPETISARLKDEAKLLYASGKSIRKFVDKRPGLERFLFWHRVNMKSGYKRDKAGTLKDRVFIDERGDIDGKYGHWEGDFIVSKHNTWVLLVLVERLTQRVIIRLLPNRNNRSVNEAIVRCLGSYAVNSLTLDNDIAFGLHKELALSLGCQIFFTHPYCSWEKGLIENVNKQIRVFVPKRTNLALLDVAELKHLEDWLNYTPRLCLNGKTAHEMMAVRESNIFDYQLFVTLPTVRIGG